MTEASNDPEVFLTEVDQAIEDIIDEIENFLEESVELFNGAIAALGTVDDAIVGGIKGFFTGGPAGAVEGSVEAAADALLEDYEKGKEDIEVEWEKAETTIRESIGAILGDPLKMSSIASAYRDAIELLGQTRNEIDSANGYIANSWSGGRAYVAYDNTSKAQLKALGGVTLSLTDAALLLDDHAVMLVTYWSNQLKALVDLSADIASAAAALGDAGNWVTLGAGVVVDLIATAAKGVAAVVDTAVVYWANLNIGQAGKWDSLQALLPDRGLQNDQWPDFASIDQGNLNGPWDRGPGTP